MSSSILAPSPATARPTSPAHTQSTLRAAPQARPPRPTAAGDVQTFALSAILAFLLIFGGGWLVAEQATPPVDDFLQTEVEMVAQGRSSIGTATGGAGGGTASDSPVPPDSTQAGTQDEWRFYIYAGAPLPEQGTDDLESAWRWSPRDDG